jgi:hypothetical protein
MRRSSRTADAAPSTRSQVLIRPVQLLCLAAAAALAFPAVAGYDENMQGVVADVVLYAYDDKIYFRLENQPTTHPECNPAYFAIDTATPADRRKMMLARLLLAKATKEPMNVGFDKTGDCSHTYIRAHRVG